MPVSWSPVREVRRERKTTCKFPSAIYSAWMIWVWGIWRQAIESLSLRAITTLVSRVASNLTTQIPLFDKVDSTYSRVNRRKSSFLSWSEMVALMCFASCFCARTRRLDQTVDVEKVGES
ncbi:hypothetical protein PENSPDRAFT_180586 [Peniophora sp. CONT]|nr:hypothetical protein PENSPDRAFT_180586 [Peniophora sp. CONT]